MFIDEIKANCSARNGSNHSRRAARSRPSVAKPTSAAPQTAHPKLSAKCAE